MFIFSLSSAKTLQISYIGMKTQEVFIKPISRVVLKSDAQQIDEIVVTAAGIRRSEKSLGYAASTVKNDVITATGDRSALNALQGKMAGVEITSASGAPGASTRVILRGFTSLSGSNQPLYIIDGVPVDNSQVGSSSINGGYDFGNRSNDINPNDIESMTVLKGGSGTALYGSRAANGVIIITTKSGASAKGKTRVDVSSTTTFDNVLRTPLMQNTFGQGWYDRDVAADLAENGSWGPKLDGVVRPWGFEIDGQQQLKAYSPLKSNVKDFFTTGVGTNNAISLSSGDENRNIYVSYSHINNDGIMPTDVDSYARDNAAVRGSLSFLTIFKLSASLNYVHKVSSYTATGQSQSALDGVWQTPRDISIIDMKDYNSKFNNIENYYTLFAQNPYYILNENASQFIEDRVYGNFSLDANILPWLTATFRIGADVSDSNMKYWESVYQRKRADYNNSLGSVGINDYKTSELNTDFQLKVNKSWNDFTLTAVVGHNFNQREYRNNESSVKGLSIPGLYNLSNSSSTPVLRDFYSMRRMVGVYGSADLSWKNILYLNITARNDWSSTLPEANRSFFYPGTSLSFVFSELIENKDILSFGKVRVGFAQTGNDANPYLLNTVMRKTRITDGYIDWNYPLAGGVNGYSVSNTIGNQSLKPELSTDIEAGVDLRFFDSRLNVDFTYYNKTVKDLIWEADIPASSGSSYQVMNLGKITNKGVELGINVTPIRTREWNWEVYLNYSRNKNKLVELTSGLDEISLGGTSSIGFVGIPGKELGLFTASVPETDPEGHVVVDATGLPVYKSQQEVVGSSQNKYRLGFGTALRYKNWSLKAAFDYRNGGLMYTRTAEMMYFTGNAPQTLYNDRQPWIIPNSVQKDLVGNYFENTVPVSGYSKNLNLYYNQTYMGGKGGSYTLVDKTFLKLRELSVTYEIPKTLLTKLKVIQNASLSFVGRNLFIWTPSSNIFTDPESTTFGNDLEANYGEYGATPTTRNLGFSINIGF